MTILIIPRLFGISLEVYFIWIIIGTLLYFLFRWVYRKIEDPNKRNLSIFAAVIITTPIIYIVSFIILFMIINYRPSRDFDKIKWREDIEKRYEFAEDLIESDLLIGKTKNQVISILGDDHNNMNQDTWSYYLGYGSENIDPDSLYIEFKNGKVIRVIEHHG